MLGRGRRVVRRRAMVGTAMGVAATTAMVSSARRNRAERHAIEQQNQQAQNQAPEAYGPYEEQQVSSGQSDMAAQLEELNQLRMKGVLTQEEFDAKKKQILGI